MARKRRSMVPARRQTMRGPSPALRRTQAALTRSRKALAAARVRGKGKGGTMFQGATTALGGGAVSGVVMAYMPAVGPVDSRLLVGGALVAAGAWLLPQGKMATGAICAGAGTLACYVSDMIESMISGE